MIGIGLDICEIPRIERELARGEGFLKRYYTESEREYIEARGGVGAQSAAAMFSAKEALLKAMGIGIGGGVPLCDIGVLHDAAGRPEYALTGAALAKMREMGATRAHLSISHDAGVAAAVAVLE